MLSKSNHGHQSELAELLNRVAINEMQTHLLYKMFLSKADGRSSRLTPLIKSALAEDYLHFDEVNACLSRLDPLTAAEHADNLSLQISADDVAKLPKASVLKLLCRTEARSIALYNRICQMTLEVDYRTFDLAYRNMHENACHLDTMQRLLEVEHGAHASSWAH